MLNPWNPLADQIREWAYTPGAEEPCQDWDLALSWSGHEKAILDCAADEKCPNQTYMLGILYLIVGDAVRSGFQTRAQPIIEGFIRRGDEYPQAEIRLWQERSRELIGEPGRFDYEQWCCGGLARTSEGEKRNESID